MVNICQHHPRMEFVIPTSSDFMHPFSNVVNKEDFFLVWGSGRRSFGETLPQTFYIHQPCCPSITFFWCLHLQVFLIDAVHIGMVQEEDRMKCSVRNLRDGWCAHYDPVSTDLNENVDCPHVLLVIIP